MLRMTKIKDKNILKHLCVMLGLNIIGTILSLVIKHIGFTEVPIVVTYLLSVLLTSQYTRGYIYGIMASVISILSFNFFFTVPIYTLKVEDSTYIFTFLVMLLSAIFTSTLTSKLIRSKELANDREKQAHILYSITSSLAKTSEVTDVAAVSARYLSNLLECEVSCIIVNKDGNLSQKLTISAGNREIINTEVSTNEINEAVKSLCSIPITIRNKTISLICIPKALEDIIKENQFIFDSIIMQITIAMERELLINEKETAKSEIKNERFKNNLLRAISHDLRTPLTRITGAAEILRHSLKDDEIIKLVSEIYEDSTWLTRLVENILSLTRIQEGRLTISLRPEAVEEIVAESIQQASKNYPDHKISIMVPDEVLFIPMDGKLIVQVLINLIENAIKHTTPSEEIKVKVWLDNKKAWFEVSDNGIGINTNDIPKLFDMFFVGSNSGTDVKQGMGLGLSICKSIINYHGGEIYAQNNAEGGATFKFYLNV